MNGDGEQSKRSFGSDSGNVDTGGESNGRCRLNSACEDSINTNPLTQNFLGGFHTCLCGGGMR